MILLRPTWLIALPLIAILAVALHRRASHAGGWQQVLPPRMHQGLIALGQIDAGSHWQRYLPVAAATALVIGLAGPALQRGDAAVFAQSDAVIIAIDMSPSIARSPALDDAKAAAAGLLPELAGRPVGLILYAGEAYAVAAPTDDPATLETQISVLDDETMPDEGSRPAAAISLAGQMLDGVKRADLVLVTDGGGFDATARAEAARLQGKGVHISALTVTGDPPSDTAALAQMMNGPVDAAASPNRVERALRSAALAPDPAMRSAQYRDLGPWFALLALLSLLPLFRRRA